MTAKRSSPTQTHPPADTDAPPSAKQLVSDSLLDAAERLFGQRGPNAVTLRDIAAEAGVNFGLLYQYLGTRANLLQAVFERVSERASPALADAPDFAAAIALMRSAHSEEAYARMLAWALLEGHPLPVEHRDRPATVALFRHARAALAVGGRTDDGQPDDNATGNGDPDDIACRTLLALVFAFHLGWRLFGPHYLQVFDLAGRDDEVDEVVSDVLGHLPQQLALQLFD